MSVSSGDVIRHGNGTLKRSNKLGSMGGTSRDGQEAEI